MIGIIMGGKTDYEHLVPAIDLLKEMGVPYEVNIVSAHRTPEWMFEYAKTAEQRGIRAIIAAAGGAAHLPGMVASLTVVPVIGVPMPTTALQGVDALLSIVQMPKGVPVATMAIGKPGAANAALFAVSILGIQRPGLRRRLEEWRKERADAVRAETLP